MAEAWSPGVTWGLKGVLVLQEEGGESWLQTWPSQDGEILIGP